MKPKGPVTVAQQSFLSQTSGIGYTTLFTPTEDGEFILALYTEADTTSGGGVDPQFSYTDDNGVHGTATASVGGGIIGHASVLVVVHAISGQPIQVYVPTPSGTVSYSVFATVISL